jgi:hypothetical protein
MRALIPPKIQACLLFLTLPALCLSAFSFTPEEVSIQIEVTLQTDPPSISLQWEHTSVPELNFGEQAFYIYRCDAPFNPSPSCLANIEKFTLEVGTHNYSFTDTNVQVR